MSEIVVTAVITPKAGQADKVEKLLTGHAAWVEANEPGTLRYRLHKQLGKEPPAFVMIETYKDKAAIDAHGNTEPFKAMGKQLAGLVETTIYATRPVGGFESKGAPASKL